MKTAQEILEEIRARKGKLDRTDGNTVTDEETATANAIDEQMASAQDSEGQEQQLVSDQDGRDQDPVSVPVTLTGKGAYDSPPGTTALQGPAGDSIGGPLPHRATHRASTGGEPPADRGLIGDSLAGDSAPNPPITGRLSAPAADREVVAEEKPEPAEADIDDDTSPYDPVLWQRLEDLALLVADLQDRTTTNSEAVDQLVEEVEELRGNLLAQDEDPDEIARRLDEIEDTLTEIEGERGLVEATESEQATRGFPWWVAAVVAGGAFALALAANRSSPPAPRENTGGAGAPDIGLPVAAISEPPVPVTAPGQQFPPAVRRLMEKGYRPDELVWKAD